jgi:hypothetical protein
MKRLVLNRETLKTLSPSEARRVQGGRPPETIGACESESCSTNKTCPPMPPVWKPRG